MGLKSSSLGMMAIFAVIVITLIGFPNAHAAYLSQFGSSGTSNGQFDSPNGIAFDSSGNIYVADYTNDRVQKFDSSGTFQGWIGNCSSDSDSGNCDTVHHVTTSFCSDCFVLGTSGTNNGQFNHPDGVAFDSSGNIYVADRSNARVEKFDSTGAFQGWIGNCSSDDDSGNCDTVNHVTKFFCSDCTVLGSTGTGDGQFSDTTSIAIDSSNNIYVTDTFNNRVEKFNSAGTYQSQFGSVGSGNGQFNLPHDVAIDGSGNLYVTDTNNNRVQKFDSAGVYQSLFGTSGSGNGQFNSPVGIAFDSSGNIYVAEQGNNRVQKFDSAGVYKAQFGSAGTGDGQFSGPTYMAIDSSSSVYVADNGNNRVQKINLFTTITTPTNGETVTTSLPTISGTTDIGNDHVNVYEDTCGDGCDVLLGSPTVVAGAWTFTPVTEFSNGDHTIFAKGAIGEVEQDTSAYVTFTVDAIPIPPIQAMFIGSTDHDAKGLAFVGGHLYSISPRDKLIREINPMTGATTGVPTTITLATHTVQSGNGLAVNPINHMVYALLKIDNIPATRELVTINPTTGVATDVGNTGDNFAGIAFGADGTLYGVTGNGATVPDTIFTINTGNALTTLFVALPSSGGGESIAFNPTDGFLYNAQGYPTAHFKKIDLVTKSITPISISGTPLTQDGEEPIALTFDSDTGSFLWATLNDNLYNVGGGKILYGIAYSGPSGPSTLYTIDPTTGAATSVGPITGFDRCGAMDFNAAETLFATCVRHSDSVAVLVTINTATGAATVVGSGTSLDQSISDISFRNSDGTLFAFAVSEGNTLNTIDTSTGIGAYVAHTGSGQGNGMAFSPSDVLYKVDSSLNTLDQSSGIASPIASLTFPSELTSPRINAMDTQPSTGIMFVSLNDPPGNNYLATVDTAGVVTKIGSTVVGLDAIAFGPPASVITPPTITITTVTPHDATINDATIKWGHSVSVSGTTTNTIGTDTVSINWGDGLTTTGVAITGGAWGPVIHTYGIGTVGDHNIVATVRGVDSTPTVVAHVQPHVTILTLNPLPDVQQNGKLSAIGNLTDADASDAGLAEHEVGGEPITFDGSGVTTLPGVNTAGITFSGDPLMNIVTCSEPTCTRNPGFASPQVNILDIHSGGTIDLPHDATDVSLTFQGMTHPPSNQDIATILFQITRGDGSIATTSVTITAGPTAPIPTATFTGDGNMGIKQIKIISITPIGGFGATFAGLSAVKVFDPNNSPTTELPATLDSYAPATYATGLTVFPGTFYSTETVPNVFPDPELKIQAHFVSVDPNYLSSDSTINSFDTTRRIISAGTGNSGEASITQAAFSGVTYTSSDCPVSDPSTALDGICNSWKSTGIPYSVAGQPTQYYKIPGNPLTTGTKYVLVELDAMLHHSPNAASLTDVVNKFASHSITLGIQEDEDGNAGKNAALPHIATLNVWTDFDHDPTNDFSTIRAYHFGTPSEHPVVAGTQVDGAVASDGATIVAPTSGNIIITQTLTLSPGATVTNTVLPSITAGTTVPKLTITLASATVVLSSAGNPTSCPAGTTTCTITITLPFNTVNVISGSIGTIKVPIVVSAGTAQSTGSPTISSISPTSSAGTIGGAEVNTLTGTAAPTATYTDQITGITLTTGPDTGTLHTVVSGVTLSSPTGSTIPMQGSVIMRQIVTLNHGDTLSQGIVTGFSTTPILSGTGGVSGAGGSLTWSTPTATVTPTAITNQYLVVISAPFVTAPGTTLTNSPVPSITMPFKGTVTGTTISSITSPTVAPLVTTTLLQAKAQVYHYALWAHSIGNNCGPSGLATISGTDLVVSLGCNFKTAEVGYTDPNGNTATVGDEQQQASTFMHELGHNLGLNHGGPSYLVTSPLVTTPAAAMFQTTAVSDAQVNCKPNYESVMSYSRQLPDFLGYPASGGNWRLDYSLGDFAAPLAESNLNEKAGLVSSTSDAPVIVYGINSGGAIKTAGTTPLGGAPTVIDWNGDTVTESIAAQTNTPTVVPTTSATSQQTTASATITTTGAATGKIILVQNVKLGTAAKITTPTVTVTATGFTATATVTTTAGSLASNAPIVTITITYTTPGPVTNAPLNVQVTLPLLTSANAALSTTITGVTTGTNSPSIVQDAISNVGVPGCNTGTTKTENDYNEWNNLQFDFRGAQGNVFFGDTESDQDSKTVKAFTAAANQYSGVLVTLSPKGVDTTKHTNSFEHGLPIPFLFQLKDTTGNFITNAQVTFVAQQITTSCTSDPITGSTITAPQNVGGKFTFQKSILGYPTNIYYYIWKTSSSMPPGMYAISFVQNYHSTDPLHPQQLETDFTYGKLFQSPFQRSVDVCLSR